ncbi:M16 family metallopeptidase [Adhaeribacter radiodurans]|uniref:Insulinase family protein n=1 Tax=Adhaeribacter radiodurans TaxID=2745197 RepID=A0A7L7LCC5_9BACT|nr:pitrilysin family protein [Adhaeribacter radiodurans]QMU30195.1 insulinase family protein [Adhaeribacter radiodurans]
MLNRTQAPALKEISAVQLPPAEIITFPNGSRLHRIHNATQPILKFEIVLKAGKWYEPYNGVSYLAAKMLLEGTQQYSARQIADIIALYGASLESNQGFDRTSITLYTLTKHFEPLVNLLAEILYAPTFPEKEFELLKIRTIQNISVEKKKNAYLANQLFTRNIYGPSHPYTTGMDEVILSQTTLPEVKEFYNTYYNLSEAEIFICGDFSSVDISKVESLFGSSSIQGEPALTKEYKPAGTIKKDFLVKEDSLQSSVRVGSAWPAMNHPYYHKLALLNKILGGYFGSRLMKNIREDKGFTYGIYSSILAKEHHTIFFIGTDVNYQNSQQTLDEIYKEVNLLKNEPVELSELQTVQNYTLGKLANDLSTIFDQAEKYKNIILHNLPLTFYSDYIKAIKSITPQELNLLANQYYILDNFYEAVVGKPVD